MMQKGLRRVALVGTPCQIKTLRKMEAMSIVPSDSIRYTLGLFCSGNFIFDEEERRKLEAIAGITWSNVRKINIKDELMLHLNTGDLKTVPLEKIDFMKRYACRFCPDYASEYADVSFGGIGAEEGWTTVITRTAIGRAIMADAKDNTLELYDVSGRPEMTAAIRDRVRDKSMKKKAYSKRMHDALLLAQRGGRG